MIPIAAMIDAARKSEHGGPTGHVVTREYLRRGIRCAVCEACGIEVVWAAVGGIDPAWRDASTTSARCWGQS